MQYISDTVDKNASITANDFSIMLDTNETISSVNWLEKSSALSDDNGSITATVKTQGDHGTFAVENNNLIYLRGKDGNFSDSGILTLSNGDNTVDVTVTVNTLYWKQIATGQYYTMAIKSDGTLWGWGANNYGQLGDGTTIDRTSPVKIGNDNHWKKVFAKFNHTMAIKTDGTLWGWGYNQFGQLGIGTTTNQHSPIQEPSRSTDWTDIAIGYYHTLAIKSDGTLWASGRNNYGQLGDNTTADKHIFTAISPSITDWSNVAAGYYHSAALRKDGTLWSWGHNNYGQVGDGSTSDRHQPTQEAFNDNDWQKIAAGYNYTISIKSDGSLYGWGYNSYANLGDGTRTQKNIPTQEASAATDWVAVDGGNFHTVAIKSDGTLWGWGYNNYGQLGSKSAINSFRYAPELIVDDANYTVAHASQYHTAAMKANGVIDLWGTVLRDTNE